MDEANILGRRFEFNNEFFKEPRRYGAISLLQIGELCCECGYEVAPHVQVCSEVSFILSGKGFFTVNGERFPVGEGDIFINQKGELHSIQSSNQQNLRFLYVGFEVDRETEDEELRPVFEFFSNPIRERKRRDKMDIIAHFLKMLNEIYNVSTYSERMVTCYLTQVIILTYRMFNPPEVRSVTPFTNENVVGGAVYGVIRYIDKNILNIGSVKGVAGDLGYSSVYLSHLFRRKTGMTLQSYISYKKMEKSLELMDSGCYSITQVALMLNFESVQSFSKAFKRTLGFSPSGYQSGRAKQENAVQTPEIAARQTER